MKCNTRINVLFALAIMILIAMPAAVYAKALTTKDFPPGTFPTGKTISATAPSGCDGCSFGTVTINAAGGLVFSGGATVDSVAGRTITIGTVIIDITSATDYKIGITTYTIDNNGLVTSVKTDGSTVTKIVYNADGTVKSKTTVVTDASGTLTSDANGNPTSMCDKSSPPACAEVCYCNVAGCSCSDAEKTQGYKFTSGANDAIINKLKLLLQQKFHFILYSTGFYSFLNNLQEISTRIMTGAAYGNAIWDFFACEIKKFDTQAERQKCIDDQACSGPIGWFTSCDDAKEILKSFSDGTLFGDKSPDIIRYMFGLDKQMTVSEICLSLVNNLMGTTGLAFGSSGAAGCVDSGCTVIAAYISGERSEEFDNPEENSEPQRLYKLTGKVSAVAKSTFKFYLCKVGTGVPDATTCTFALSPNPFQIDGGTTMKLEINDGDGLWIRYINMTHGDSSMTGNFDYACIAFTEGHESFVGRESYWKSVGGTNNALCAPVPEVNMGFDQSAEFENDRKDIFGMGLWPYSGEDLGLPGGAGPDNTPPPASTCPNAICEADETTVSCPADCKWY